MILTTQVYGLRSLVVEIALRRGQIDPLIGRSMGTRFFGKGREKDKDDGKAMVKSDIPISTSSASFGVILWERARMHLFVQSLRSGTNQMSILASALRRQ